MPWINEKMWNSTCLQVRENRVFIDHLKYQELNHLARIVELEEKIKMLERHLGISELKHAPTPRTYAKIKPQKKGKK